MDIIVVDSDRGTHEELVQSVREAYPDSRVQAFLDPLLALKHGVNNSVDMLITAARMRGADGAQLTRLLRRAHPELWTVFVTDGPLRRHEDLNAAPDAVLQRPVTAQALREILDMEAFEEVTI